MRFVPVFAGRLFEIRQIGNDIGMFARLVSRGLTNERIGFRDRGRTIRITDNAPAHDLFEPQAPCRIAADRIVEMPTVAGNVVAEIRRSDILNRIHTVHNQTDFGMSGYDLLRRAAYHLVHFRLIVTIIAEFNAGVALFRRPRGMIYESGIGTFRSHVIQQIRKIGLHRMSRTFVRRIVKPVESLTFLNADKRPVLVCQRRRQFYGRGFGHNAIHNLTITVSRRIRCGIRSMSFQRTSADIHISDDHLLPHGFEEPIQLLLDRIGRETVTDRKDFDGFGEHRNLRFGIAAPRRSGRSLFGIGAIHENQCKCNGHQTTYPAHFFHIIR